MSLFVFALLSVLVGAVFFVHFKLMDKYCK